jgi:hypothetical protein
MKFIRYLSVVILGWATATSAAPFDGQSARLYLDTLCSREFAGRKSGDPEMAKCERWAADNFKLFGLEPGGSEGYLQPFPILNNREMKASLELISGIHGRKKYGNGEDFHTNTNSGSGKVQAEVVFAGYGICEPGMERDDFAGIDLKGKIALIYKAVPGSERLWDKQRWRDYKLTKAVQHGAVAVIFVNDQYAISGAALHQDAFFPQVPVIIVSEHVADDLFRGSGKRYANVKKALEKAPQSFATGNIVRLEVRMRHNPEARAANVIGVLHGSDSTLMDEWIVVGGHMDHNGVNAEGDVFYGADDNASGAAIMLELARGFASRYPTPKRSLMFMEFAAEEQGLLGSQWFVDHPTIPKDKIAAMINFDCCGMGSGGVGFGGAEHFPEIWQAYEAQMDSGTRANLTLSTIWHGGSDNSSFQDAGIPTFNYWSSGDRPFYHHQEDLPGQIATTTLGKVGQEASNFIQFMANWEKPVITENYKERAWLYSACSIFLNGYGRPPLQEVDVWAETMKNNHDQQGLKCAVVSISPEDPFGDVDFWRQFCKNHNFSFVTGKDGIREAMRKQKLAVLPVISNIAVMDVEAVYLRNLAMMGIKIASVGQAETDSSKRAKAINEAAELGMTFICEAALRHLLPQKSKRILVYSNLPDKVDLPAKEELDKVRLVFPYNLETAFDHETIKPDSGGIVSRVVALDFWTNGPLSGSLIKLEQAGFSGQEIVYMMGENLLEVLP